MARPTDHLLLPAGRSAIGEPDGWSLPLETTRVLARVARTPLPLLCLGCSGAAFARLAAGVHQASERQHLARVDLRRRGAGLALGLPRGLAASELTLALDGIEHLDDHGQSALEAYLDEASPRLLCASEATLSDLRRTWRGDLLALLSTVTVHAPSLARRPGEVADLAAARLSVLAKALGEGTPDLSAGAAASLAAHGWPGDVAELDAVLLRTILRVGSGTIQAADLVWEPEGVHVQAPAEVVEEPSPAPSHAPSPVAPSASDEDGTGALEALAVELAHQLKNPLVTVKTFVQGSTRMSAPDLEQFQEIALESVHRIDGHLDRLLDFSRLGGDPLEPVDVMAALAAAVRENATDFAAKTVRVEDLPVPGIRVQADPRSLEFAMDCLVRHVAECIEPGSVLAVRRPRLWSLALVFRESGTATHLRGVTGDPSSSFPLALLLVRGALKRMGGALRASHEDNEVAIELSFSPV
ncbi:MAG: hypothetical protein FJ144_04040 [Deltaproteobacteria bacterium]|nr:hypothetical protein [Deltaproteobacteria bacterium]